MSQQPPKINLPPSQEKKPSTVGRHNRPAASPVQNPRPDKPESPQEARTPRVVGSP